MITPIALARLIGQRFLARQETANTYNNQLAYEALLFMTDDIPGVDQQVARVITENKISADHVIPWRHQQFHDLAYAWFQRQQQLEEYQASHLSSTEQWMADGPRRSDRALIHKCTHDPSGTLLDMLQAYAIRLARAAAFTNDKKYIDELMHQFRIHEMVLRDKQTGCYHQGIGWLEHDAISPGTWSRGQGWLLHGMVHCLFLMDPWPEEQQELLDYTLALLNTLAPLQDANGLWHQLIDTPAESFPDTSGSALILEAYTLTSAYMQDYTYKTVIQTAWSGIAAQVDANGIVDQACKGPGPIWETAPWRNNKAGTDDPHGVFSTLFACAALHQHPQYLD